MKELTEQQQRDKARFLIIEQLRLRLGGRYVDGLRLVRCGSFEALTCPMVQHHAGQFTPTTLARDYNAAVTEKLKREHQAGR